MLVRWNILRLPLLWGVNFSLLLQIDELSSVCHCSYTNLFEFGGLSSAKLFEFGRPSSTKLAEFGQCVGSYFSVCRYIAGESYQCIGGMDELCRCCDETS